ncbi:MAG: nodulation protein NfeD [Hydrogenovibrio crunogenus]|nr:nodulation protein NfeD [Hydrogenovibrio crunogenus]
MNHVVKLNTWMAWLIWLGVFLQSAPAFSAETTKTLHNQVVQLTVQDAIGPATVDYIERSLEKTAQQRAELVVIQLDTPGGLSSAMRSIIQAIARSPVPVATFVAPSGARAASAGTYILYASHIAAMAPGTNLGAATPVQMGGISLPNPSENSQKTPNEPASEEASKRKVINDAVAYIQGLAQLHNRNADWAEKAVREAASLPANEALKLNVIDVIADNLRDLLQQVDGKQVTLNGQTINLKTADANIVQLAPDWRSELLSVITNPNIAYILLLIGVYGLIFEFLNPGGIVPGTIGAIALVLALYAFQLLPINYAGMALILLGVGLMIGEAFEPSFGILGIGGTVAFVFGSIILMDTDAPGFGIDLSVIITFAVISALILIAVVHLALKSYRQPIVSGVQELVGAEARVVEDFDRQGHVIIHGEHWQAISQTPLKQNQMVKVTGLKNLTLTVEPVE